jgi:hypothetical protein
MNEPENEHHPNQTRRLYADVLLEPTIVIKAFVDDTYRDYGID